MDLDGLEKVIDPGTRMLILCSPHNPVGRVWERQTLSRLADICRSRGVLVVSDEIHCDLVMPGFRHAPIAAVSEASAANSVTLVAATKTFNLAGLGGSISIVPDKDRRTRFEGSSVLLSSRRAGNALGIAAAEAAWRSGASWLDEALVYISGNYDFMKSFLAAKLPAVNVFPLEGTYLALLDFAQAQSQRRRVEGTASQGRTGVAGRGNKVRPRRPGPAADQPRLPALRAGRRTGSAGEVLRADARLTLFFAGRGGVTSALPCVRSIGGTRVHTASRTAPCHGS